MATVDSVREQSGTLGLRVGGSLKERELSRAAGLLTTVICLKVSDSLNYLD